MPPTPLVNASVFPFEVNQLPVNEQAQLHVASSHWFGVWMNFDITSCAKYRSVWNHLGNKFFCTKYLEVFWQTFKPKSAQLQKYGTICAVNGTRVSFFFLLNILTWAAGVLTRPRILNTSSNCSRKWENYSTPFRKIRETDHVPVKAPSCLQSDPVWSVG